VQGALVAGAIANPIGAPHTLMIGGAICICGGGWFSVQLPAIRKLVRPIYQQIGIIPEVARGIHTASVLREQAEE